MRPERFRGLVRVCAGSCALNTQTTNLGVRSSNLFGRASQIRHFCDFRKLVPDRGLLLGYRAGQYRKATSIERFGSDMSLPSAC